ncbi:MAG: ATP-binding protein [Clostridia bacterium]|nr:ATP-binding protein [Clostridia bacterium]
MAEVMKLHYVVSGDDFTRAGETSSKVKKTLNQLGFRPEVVRKVAIAMYEGEINMVIHADGGTIDVDISSDEIVIVMQDKGPGIPDVEKAMQEGFSTASNNVRELGFGAGMGLPNIKKYSDVMEIDTQVGKGTKLRIVIYAKE